MIVIDTVLVKIASRWPGPIVPVTLAPIRSPSSRLAPAAPGSPPAAPGGR